MDKPVDVEGYENDNANDLLIIMCDTDDGG